MFPPFNKSDLAFGKEDLQKHLNEETTIFEKSLPELRAIMTFGDYSAQQEVAKLLLESGDQEATLRIVYTLKQGSLIGVHTLGWRAPRQVIPYLMEDVAHGSMEDLSGRWPMMSYDKVRFAATEIVAGILNEIEEFPEPTKEWLQFVESGNGYRDVYDLSQKSKFLVEWWILNEKAFMEGRWNEAVPVPHAGSYPPRPKPDLSPAGAGEYTPPPEDETPEPWKFKPLEVSESFEDWSARIVHPERRDLRWVKLTFENGKWVEHAPVRLDPLAPPAMPSRNVRRPTPSAVSISNDAPIQWPVWVLGLAMLCGLLLWWLMKTPNIK